jgi:hypothetical protein
VWARELFGKWVGSRLFKFTVWARELVDKLVGAKLFKFTVWARELVGKWVGARLFKNICAMYWTCSIHRGSSVGVSEYHCCPVSVDDTVMPKNEFLLFH